MKPDEARSRLLCVEQAAERLGVKPATIRSWILKRQKLEIVKVGRLVRITEKSIDEFINKNTMPPGKAL
jgi:excisionase family DNA binding protein